MSKSALHPRNQHQVVAGKAYDLTLLTNTNPDLEKWLVTRPDGEQTVNFSEPDAVKQLNKALLLQHYDIVFWDIPADYLCPPVPGRADYIHHLADLLALANDGQVPKGKQVKGLDVGTGANLIYPIVGTYEYGWQFVGSDIEPVSLSCAQQLIKANPRLKKSIKLRQQNNSKHIFQGILKPEDKLAFTLCNPPFHASKKQAEQGTNRKNRNLGQSKGKLNFGGQSNELWCPGGEAEFVCTMVRESSQFANQVLWFTSLISSKDNLSRIKRELKKINCKQVKIIEMGQGNKVSRFIAWSFFEQSQQQGWFR